MFFIRRQARDHVRCLGLGVFTVGLACAGATPAPQSTPSEAPSERTSTRPSTSRSRAQRRIGSAWSTSWRRVPAFENLTRLAEVPARGAWVIALPMDRERLRRPVARDRRRTLTARSIPMKLFDISRSPNCRKVRVLARELDLPLEVVAVDFASLKEPAYLARNPTGKVPTFVDDDGFVLWESNAILIHLAEKRPE